MVAIEASEDIIRARRSGRDIARSLDFSLADQTRLATAISEIARNALHYGGGGRCEILGHRAGVQREITIIISDAGPGIPDVAQAMIPGFSTGHSLGMGIPGARKLMDRLDIESRVGRTMVVMTMVRRFTT
ncbi:MAG: anti-sigma regulatory factor [Azospirillaceae bacterium]|nr:anti-sigma regulatory factor [Azospirillaceae bacterium]